MTYPKTVAEITEYSTDERGIKRIIFQTKQEHIEYIQRQSSNVYLIEDRDNTGEIETLLGCTAAISFLGVSSLIRDRAIEDKYSKSLSELMTEVKDLADNFFKDRIPTSKILEHEFNQRVEDLKSNFTKDI